MARSLNDPYHSVRLVIRIDALVLGFGLGILLFAWPVRALAGLGLEPLSALWPVRLAGALLISLGISLLLASGETPPAFATLVTTVVANSLVALVLLVAYLQQELAGLTLFGQILLILLFVVCLVSALWPIPFVQAELRYR